jgi:hypothetical protein
VSSALPTDDALTKAVDTFGNGPYDGQRDEDLHGEDDESREPAGSSLPSEPSEGFDIEFMLSYPQEQALGPKHASSRTHSIDWFFSSLLPGDGDRPPPGPRPADATIDDLAAPPSDVRISDSFKSGPYGRPERTTNTADSELPSDADNPAARSDYYDKMTMGGITGRPMTHDVLREEILDAVDRIMAAGLGDIWPSEDSGSYVTQETKEVSPELDESDEPFVMYQDGDGHYVDQDGDIETYPEPEDNDESMEDGLGALENGWSGYVVEDLSNPSGFPTDNFTEEADYMDEAPNQPEIWHLQPFGFASTASFAKADDIRAIGRTVTDEELAEARKFRMITKTATDVEKVRELTAAFLKAHGRKSIVRRSVLSFLQGEGLPQYLASDVIRCMKHDHGILVPDVMDTFPLAKEAPEDLRRLASLHGQLLELSMTTEDPRVSSRLSRCAASVARALAKLERGLSDLQ